MWFIMDLGKRLGRPELIDKAVKIALSTIEYGWDKEYGGMFYFMDRLGRPQQQLEWDQKLWWVHIESAITMIKAYQLTGNKECLAWFQKLHDYMWTHFKDPKYPEWFGYLNRRGEGAAAAQGRQVEGVFSCSARTLPDLADPRTMQIGGSFPMPDKRFAGLKRCRDI